MTRRRKVLLVLTLVLIVSVLGRLFLNAPIARIQLAPETIVNDVFGRWDLSNSLISAWIAMGVVLTLAYLATRRMQMVPRGVQNLMESAIGGLLGIVETVAGKRHGRRFFPLVTTIFLFIVAANLIALLPVFGTIGKVDSAEFELTEALEESADDLAGETADADLKVIYATYKQELRAHRKSDQRDGPPPDLTADLLAKAGVALDARQVAKVPRARAAVVNDAFGKEGDEPLFIFDRTKSPFILPTGFNKVKELELGEYWDIRAWQPFHVSGRERICPNSGKRASGTVVCSDEETVDLDGKTVGILVPYLRSPNTDLMMPLGMALVAMTFVHIWGIQANGFGAYRSRFLNTKQGLVMFFVGVLESIGEMARILSFSFRLLGNTFAGEVLILAFLFLLPIMVGILAFPFFLETFVAFIQAVVFFGLVLVFATLAVTPHEGHTGDEKGESSHQ